VSKAAVSNAPEIAVVAGHADSLLDDARQLILEYAASLPFDLTFQGFDDELATLPGAYAPPRGRLLIARLGSRSIGCVGLRPLDRHTAELKRLWVRPEARETGVGKLLVGHAVEHARAAGYARIRLDTTPGMEAAQALYRSFGFVEIPAYRPNPIPGATYLELSLRASA
jgi:ribosomal protein S18 acetylase RimI-like enzyme